MNIRKKCKSKIVVARNFGLSFESFFNHFTSDLQKNDKKILSLLEDLEKNSRMKLQNDTRKTVPPKKQHHHDLL